MAPLTRWHCRLAAHLGIASPDAPMFAASAASIDPVAQIEHAAALGFSGITDNGLKRRTPADQRRMGAAQMRLGLAMGSFTHCPPGEPPYPWTHAGIPVEPGMAETIASAHRVGGGTINVILCDSGERRDVQCAAARDNLLRAADLAAREGLVIGVEPASRSRVPGALIESADQAAAIVRAVAHPAVGLILDSCHVHLTGDDMANALRRHAPLLVGVQIADMPGRVEPGAGTLDMPAIVATLAAIGWSGLVEAEFFASRPGAAGEQAMLDALDRLCAV